MRSITGIRSAGRGRFGDLVFPLTTRTVLAGLAVLVGLTLFGAASSASGPPGLSQAAGQPGGGPAPAEGCSSPWVAPVDAPITDPFRPPDHRYGPGNRGIEYGTEPGQSVVAVGAGVVQFAGPVAGRPVIVIDHGAGLRSSYVNLMARSVNRGHVVARGQLIASAETGFHLGVRRGSSYLDPAELIERLCEVVRLVPT